MNTLCPDLLSTIRSLTKVSHLVLLGLETTNNEPYLDLITNVDRYKLALRNHNVNWILETFICLHNFKHAVKYKCDWIIKHFAYRPCYDDILFSNGYQCSVDSLTYLPYYYYGKRGDPSIFDHPYFKDHIKNIGLSFFLLGLSKAQNYELFDNYCELLGVPNVHIYDKHTANISKGAGGKTNTDRIRFANLLTCYLNFEDEDYIVNGLKKLKIRHDAMDPDKLYIKLHTRKQYKVIEYLSQFIKIKNQNTYFGIYGHILGNIEYKFEGNDLNSCVMVVCLRGDLEALEFIKTHTPETQKFMEYIEAYCVDANICQHYLNKPSVNEDLFEFVQQIRPYLIFDSSCFNCKNLYDLIVGVLKYSLEHHLENKKTKISFIKDMFRIMVKSRMVELNYFYRKIYFPKDENFVDKVKQLLSNRNIRDLRLLAKKMHIKDYDTLPKDDLLLEVILQLN